MLEALAELTRDGGAETELARYYECLRRSGLTAFGEAMFGLHPLKNPPPNFPRMASDEVQRSWTGDCGQSLLVASIDFVRAMMLAFATNTGRRPSGIRILDYGCGYGRIARLVYFFTDPENVFGVDPWDESIRHCRECGLGENFIQSDYVPQSLPVVGTFDLIYAFSVFTHLSERTALAALRVLRGYLRPDGMLCITIRPKEFWAFRGGDDAGAAAKLHDEKGFSFIPHNRLAIDGDITYGDTSMSPEWLSRAGWTIHGLDYSLSDSLQLYAFLTPI